MTWWMWLLIGIGVGATTTVAAFGWWLSGAPRQL
jgi:hypothetical protein